MKIIGGEFGGRSLDVSKGQEVRPTSSRLRAQVFNILQHHVEGASFLDVCAGSGAMGLEALSRGAKRALFLEESVKSIQTLRKNIKSLGVEEKTEILVGDARQTLSRLALNADPFDIIYIDPPYYTGSRDKTSSKMLSAEILRVIDLHPSLYHESSIIAIEESKRADIRGLTFERLSLSSVRISGDSQLVIFTVNGQSKK